MPFFTGWNEGYLTRMNRSFIVTPHSLPGLLKLSFDFNCPGCVLLFQRLSREYECKLFYKFINVYGNERTSSSLNVFSMFKTTNSPPSLYYINHFLFLWTDYNFTYECKTVMCKKRKYEFIEE